MGKRASKYVTKAKQLHNGEKTQFFQHFNLRLSWVMLHNESTCALIVVKTRALMHIIQILGA